MSAEVERSLPTSADVSLLVRDRVAWAIAGGVALLAGALSTVIDNSPGLAARVLYTAIPVAVLAVVLAMTLRRGAVLSAGALAIAVTPAGLAAVAAGAQWGAVAVLAACAAVVLAWWGRDAAMVATVAALVTVVGIGAWAASTPDQLTSPTWGQATKRTGELLWSSVGGLDEALIVPATGWLIWWVSAGLVAGAALVGGAVRSAAVIPLAAAVMIAAGWAIIRWRGDVDMTGGVWIVAGATAYVGASIRLDEAPSRRIGVTLLAVAAFIWIVTIVHLIRN
jgi:hypothetical protein